MHEDVPAAHLAQEDAPGCVVEEADVVQWRKAVSPEHDTQDEMLDAGATAVEQLGEMRTMPIIPILDNSMRFFTQDLLLKNEFVLISHQPLIPLFSH